MDEALEQPLTLIVAPAGSGKSVLLAQWAEAHPDLAVVWLPLTSADDDPVRFSRRLLAGLAGLNAEAADLGPLVSMHGGGLGTQLLEALGPLLAELPETAIVLDDLHLLSNPTLLSDLSRLVEQLPPEVHLILATRVDPPIAWSRHRVHRGLSELRQSDLAFDSTDTARLLERITGRSLEPDQVDALLERTEGWAVGLQLAGMMLRVRDDSGAFISRFSGSDRFIADYLSEEVLEAQSAERRSFLLRSSVVDEMCAELAVRLTGEPRSQLVLEELERQSMFLVPLDDRREWYRFHHLFRDLLRFRLRAEEPGIEAELLTEAAHWHLERGDFAPAVEYLLQARQWDEALDLIMSRGSEIFEQGQMATVIRWATEVPDTVRAERREVTLLLGFLKVAEGQAAGGEDLLASVVADPGATPGEQACAQALLCSLAQFRSNPEVTVEMAHTAMDMIGRLDGGPVPAVMNLGDPRVLETVSLGSCGRGHFLAGRMEEAREWLERSLESAGAAYSVWKIAILGSLALVEAWSGRLERAEALAEEALGVAREAGILIHPITSDAFLATTMVALERGQPRHAALALREGCLRSEANRRIPLTWIGRLLTAELQAAEGHPDQAAATAATPWSELGAPPPPLVEHGLVALRCRLLRLAGDTEEAERLLRGTQVDAPAVVAESVATALAAGRVDYARKLLEGTEWAKTEPRPTVERLVSVALLASAEGDPDEAGRRLDEALDVASVHGLVEVFVRAGPRVIQLVADPTSGSTPFGAAVLARAREATAPAPGHDLADPLTDRELEIVSYLASRLTNTELAEQCYVSVNTIKTHMAHIYRKLEVPNRKEAIVRARELGLL